MKTRMLWTMLTVVGTLTGSGWAAGQSQNSNQGPTVVAPVTAPLTAAETANLQHMRNEEKLARDVYRTFAEKWNCPIFTNIAGAEQQHLEAVGLLITKYGVMDPVTDDTVGVFSDPEFTSLYTTLTQSGVKSLLDALKAGVEIEEADIASLKTALSQTDKSDIQWVLGNLQRASYNHLRAFTRNVEAGGTACPVQSVAANAGNGRGSGQGVCPACGRGGRGYGKCYRNGNGSGNQNGAGRGMGLRMRDGSCLMLRPAQP
jgi:hypothetical protein